MQSSLVKLNGLLYEYKPPLSIYNLLEYLGFNLNVILVDYNGAIVQKHLWTTIQIKNKDNLEILTLAGGG